MLGLQGGDYKLYDPEIATIEKSIEAPSTEGFFCNGNLTETAINNFFATQKCNVFCLELKMVDIELGESEEDEE